MQYLYTSTLCIRSLVCRLLYLYCLLGLVCRMYVSVFLSRPAPSPSAVKINENMNERRPRLEASPEVVTKAGDPMVGARLNSIYIHSDLHGFHVYLL